MTLGLFNYSSSARLLIYNYLSIMYIDGTYCSTARPEDWVGSCDEL